MSILFAMALAAVAPSAQAATPGPVDHSQHAQHQRHAQHEQHMKECHDMMAKMHQGMHPGDPAQGGAKPGADHKDHAGHH